MIQKPPVQVHTKGSLVRPQEVQPLALDTNVGVNHVLLHQLSTQVDSAECTSGSETVGVILQGSYLVMRTCSSCCRSDGIHLVALRPKEGVLKEVFLRRLPPPSACCPVAAVETYLLLTLSRRGDSTSSL